MDHKDNILRNMELPSNNNYFQRKTIKILKNAWSFTKFYMFWILTHWLCCHLYIYFCTPLTLKGFLMSPLMVLTPHCQGLQWMFEISVLTIKNMWLVFGTWLAIKFTSQFNGFKNK